MRLASALRKKSHGGSQQTSARASADFVLLMARREPRSFKTKSKSDFIRSLLGFRLLLPFMLALGAGAQTGTTDSLPKFNVSVQRVLVDVVVASADEMPVLNLRKEDFLIYEGATPQS